MNNIFKSSVWVVVILLVASNIFLFCSSIGLSDQISTFEKKISVIHEENISLETKVSYLTSLDFAKVKAPELNFTTLKYNP